ncbi:MULTISPECIES: SapC family protein [unclassified Campylobacter]|uniref:SapC family protein n=1 Tax=unclassified Campylobacter TaxID=2593542 RepID=UPI0022E9B915|nr:MULTISPECIES: SapC family protein [unclassified Campylobacter]MDA3056533.1 SapC family protein [Campylobacter sp. CN_NA1]MDA3065629.1 SapC family protein [Campylobacter sp. CN_NE4]MDA3069176.1 SapC family protein [Campylobacter sp. CN_NE3]MDA3083082.1 SapC family protein [Campylobacter sp. CN_EL2]MDA3084744.1 SapC family protein [Campylobacter sp. CN_NE1]
MKPEILDKEKHADLKYHQDTLPKNPFVPVIAPEAGICANNFVLVFTDEEESKLVALLGKTENILIDKDFKGAIPASVLNYPFFLAKIGDQNLLCIDSEAKQLQGDGEKLFENGEPSKFTENLISVMKNYNDMDMRTKIAVSEIKKAGILESKELGVEKDGVKETLLSGFLVVNPQKLYELDDKTLADFARRGYLELIYNHLRSLGNLQILVDKIVENKK